MVRYVSDWDQVASLRRPMDRRPQRRRNPTRPSHRPQPSAITTATIGEISFPANVRQRSSPGVALVTAHSGTIPPELGGTLYRSMVPAAGSAARSLVHHPSMGGRH